MKSLEQLTRDLFIGFSKRKTGRKAAWHKLKAERQVEWMDDTYYLIENTLNYIEEQLKPHNITKRPQASYEMGMVEGINRENARLKTLIKAIKDKFLRDLEDAIKEKN